MYEVLVWGIGRGYENLKRYINPNQIKINALISNYNETIKKLDGLDVVRPDEFKEYKFDYIIVADEKPFERVVKMVKYRMRGGGKCIDSRLFELDGFNFEEYILLLEKNITMVENNCYGGFEYYNLGIKTYKLFAETSLNINKPLYEVLFWGTICEYDAFISLKSQSRLKINAIISNNDFDKNIKSIDGLNLIRPNELKNYSFEYIIVADDILFKELIKRESENENQLFITARVFRIKGFDFDKYVSVMKKNISIISNNCWGGFLYHSLGLKFNTPFINLAIDEGYIKLLNNIEYYLHLPLIVEENNDWDVIKGYLGKDVVLKFWHDSSVDEIRKKWNKRIKRFNFNNYIIQMAINNDNEAINFDKLDIKTKIGFYYKQLNLNSVIYLKQWEDKRIQSGWGYTFDGFVWSTAKNDTRFFNKHFDALKLLNGEENFKRNIEYK